MSLIGQTTNSVAFKNLGDGVAGRIVAFEDYQAKVFGTNEPKVFPSGDPVMGVRITLETRPGDAESRTALWAEGKEILKAIRTAVRAMGAGDLEAGADLSVQFTGYQGRAKVFTAAYARAEETPF